MDKDTRNGTKFAYRVLRWMYHEAGHSAIALHYGHDLQTVQVLVLPISKKAYSAATVINYSNLAANELIQERMVVLYAGMRAESVALGRYGIRVSDYMLWGRSDYREIRELAELSAQGDQNKKWEEQRLAKNQALRLLRQPDIWQKVQRLVSALVDYYYLSKDDVADVLAMNPLRKDLPKRKWRIE